MAETAASTAYGPMVLVALEQTFPKEQRIIDDTLAYQMLPLYMKLMVKSCNLKFVRQIFINLMEKSMPGIWLGFPCRKRYIDDRVIETIQDGIEAVVILGAGLDTLAYRIPQLSTVQVYEVDLPENIAYKQRQLTALYGAIPYHTTLVPINFETQNLENTLTQSGYSFNQKSIFIWEAVTQYLTEAAARATFECLAKAKSGSRLIFTYVLKDFIDGENTYGLDSLYRRFRGNNQLWFFGMQPHAVADFLAAYDWEVLEDIGADEFTERYTKPTGRMGLTAEIERVVYAEKLSN